MSNEQTNGVFMWVPQNRTIDGKSFDDLYSKNVSLGYFHWGGNHIQRIGGTDPRVCAMCERTVEDGATFETEAHLLAVQLGNDSIITEEECDTCNDAYGRGDDNELGRMLLPFRVMGRVPTRSGTAKIQTKEDGSSIGGGSHPSTLPIFIQHNDDSVRLEFKGEQQANVHIATPSFSPSSAIRSVIRSAWAALPPAMRTQIPWLRQFFVGDYTLATTEFLQVFIPGGMSVTTLEVWTLKPGCAEALPSAVIKLMCSNIALIWLSPKNIAAETYYDNPILPAILSAPNSAQPSVQRVRVKPGTRVESGYTTFPITFEEHRPGESAHPPELPALPIEKPSFVAQLLITNSVRELSFDNVELTVLRDDVTAQRLLLSGGMLGGKIAINTYHKSRRLEIHCIVSPHSVAPPDALKTITSFRMILESQSSITIKSSSLTNAATFTSLPSAQVPDYTQIVETLTLLEKVSQASGQALRYPAPSETLDIRALRRLDTLYSGEELTEEEPVLTASIAREHLDTLLQAVQSPVSITLNSPYISQIIDKQITLPTRVTIDEAHIESTKEDGDVAHVTLTGSRARIVLIRTDDAAFNPMAQTAP